MLYKLGMLDQILSHKYTHKVYTVRLTVHVFEIVEGPEGEPCPDRECGFTFHLLLSCTKRVRKTDYNEIFIKLMDYDNFYDIKSDQYY